MSKNTSIHDMYCLLPGDQVQHKRGGKSFSFLHYRETNLAVFAMSLVSDTLTVSVNELIDNYIILNQFPKKKQCPCPICSNPVTQDGIGLTFPYCSNSCMAQKALDKYDVDSGTFPHQLNTVIHQLRDMLLEKNKAYGDSALNPIRVFAKGDAQDLIKVRIDDKLTRIKNLGDGDTEDAELDLLGYLILLRISKLK